MTHTNVLIVEDEGITALDVKRKLEVLGYRVPAVVSSGEEAVQSALRHRPDLVLMDISLNGEMDGVTAASAIRRHMPVPIVYFSAYPNRLPAFADSEATGYISKPYNFATLHATIETVLYKARNMEIS